jgi:hypothetical protein
MCPFSPAAAASEHGHNSEADELASAVKCRSGAPKWGSLSNAGAATLTCAENAFPHGTILA